VRNLLFILTLGSTLPFLSAVLSVIKIVPCPRLTAFVSNSALVGALIAIFLVAYLMYGNLALTYSYLMSIWPWTAIATVIARLHIGRDRELSTFSPLIHLPLMGLLGSGSMVGMIYALKSMTVIDCIVLSALDPIWSAIFHGFLIGRIPYFTRYTRSFLLLLTFVFLYIYGQTYSGGIVRSYLDSVTFLRTTETLSVSTYALFLGSRAAALLKSAYLKFSFIPREIDQYQEFKSLFPNFPFPIRYRLDAIFDSGLMEDVPHAVGPTGTRDIVMLTDGLYLLPVASIATWLIEKGVDDTLKHGLSSVSLVGGAPPVGLSYFIMFLFALGILLTPTAISSALFDRGSSPHEWASFPCFATIIFASIDLLYSNPFVSRFQIVCLAVITGLLLNLRIDLWQAFKRRYYAASLKELEFLQPSCVREAQKLTLMDATDKTSVDDFGTLVLETAIHHGRNIRDYFKKENGERVWDPNPGARAAWKLAGSMVIRAIRSRKSQLGIVKKQREDDKRFMSSVVQTFIRKVGGASRSFAN
jgi:hypothetical protein